jgi:hypothetical protein
VSLPNQLLSKTGCALSASATREGSELGHGKVAGEQRYDVEKPGLGLGIAEPLYALNVGGGNVHSAKLLFCSHPSLHAL